ncbi:MAG: hypothetical protein AVDCRST_MAG35-2378, partial [uncultured Quadrisphaera sp.]
DPRTPAAAPAARRRARTRGARAPPGPHLGRAAPGRAAGAAGRAPARAGRVPHRPRRAVADHRVRP